MDRKKTYFSGEIQFSFQSEAKLNHKKRQNEEKNVVQDIKFNCQPLFRIESNFCTLISMFIQLNQGTQFGQMCNKFSFVAFSTEKRRETKMILTLFVIALPFYSAFFLQFQRRQSGISSLINISAAAIKHFFILFMKIISF